MIAGTQQGGGVSRSPFAHLHVHSNYTLMSGASRVEEIVQAAARLGFDAVALTDTNALYGAVPFYQACEAAGIKAILGAELELWGVRAVVLARDLEGYRALCRIVTARQLDAECPTPHAPASHAKEKQKTDPVFCVRKLVRWIEPAADHLYVLTAHEKLVRALTDSAARESLVVELGHTGDYAGSKRVAALCVLADELTLPTVATNRVYFAEPEGYERHRLLTAIRHNTTLARLASGQTVSPQNYLKSADSMRWLFHDRPDVVHRSRWIADHCTVRLELGKPQLPPFPVSNGQTADIYLRHVVLLGARKRYGQITPTIRRRIETELDVIGRTGFASYFLVVWDIAREAFRRGIPTVGRGSAANSIVSYCLGLTHVCPIRHNLFFERFLHVGRTDCPDVDLDFCWRRRSEMIEWVYDRYGHDRVAMICTFQTLALRSSIRETAKVMGLLDDEIGAFTKRLPSYEIVPLKHLVAELPECHDLPIDTEPWKTIVAFANGIVGFPRHLGTHSGGLVVAPRPVTDFMPLQYAASGLAITQFDMRAVEDMGLVKIDLLGQRALSVIADVVLTVRERTGVSLDLPNLEEGDPPTIALWQRADTIGCFQIESPSMRGLLRKLHVDGIGILIAASSLVRPGPSDAGMTKQFIDRYNGREQVRMLHPRLKPLLEETFGVLVYQEDVLRVVHALSGIGFGEAELLRRSLSKKRGIEAVTTYERRFLQGAIDNGVSRVVAQKVWEQIASFAGYSFCKAHSASYAQESYQSTYLKAHYPAAFMAAVLTNGGGFYHAEVYVHEARRMGLRILSPDVNESALGWTGWDDWIRPGLQDVRSLTSKTARAIVENRQDQPYGSVDDFLERVPLTHQEAENLVRAGAFDSFGFTRPQLLWVCAQRWGQPVVSKRRAPNGRGRSASIVREAGSHSPVCLDLFYGYRSVGVCTPLPGLDQLCDYTLEERVRDEIRLLGYAVTAHPFSLYQGRLRRRDVVRICDIEHFVGRRVKVCGWYVTTRRVITERGDQMRFLSIDDMTGVLETVLFPATYSRFSRFLVPPGPYVLTGVVQEEHTHCTLTVEKVELLDGDLKGAR